MTIALHRAFIRLFQKKRIFMRKEKFFRFLRFVDFYSHLSFYYTLRLAQQHANVIYSPLSFTLCLPVQDPAANWYESLPLTDQPHRTCMRQYLLVDTVWGSRNRERRLCTDEVSRKLLGRVSWGTDVPAMAMATVWLIMLPPSLS